MPGAGAGRPGLFFGGKEGGLKGGQVKVCIVNVVVTTNGEGEGDGDVVNSVNGWRGQIGAGISDDFNSHFYTSII